MPVVHLLATVMIMPDESRPGLREKVDTLKSLSDVAVQLMFERGVENVAREDISARAGVSVRMFSDYFASKYDALAYRVGHRIRRSAELLRTRPDDEPLWDAITESLIEPLRTDGEPLGRPTETQLIELRKLNKVPQMRAAMARGITDDLVDAIAERTGTDSEQDLYPRLVADITVSALNTVMARYANSDPPVVITTLLRETLAGISEGLPPPGHGRT